MFINSVSTPYERYFKRDVRVQKWDMSGYDQNFIQNKISLEEVQHLLSKIDAEPIPQMPGLCAMMWCRCCFISDFLQKMTQYRERLNRILEDENSRLGMRGVHWSWAACGINFQNAVCLHLDFNKANALMQLGNQGNKGQRMGNAQFNPAIPNF